MLSSRLQRESSSLMAYSPSRWRAPARRILAAALLASLATGCKKDAGTAPAAPPAPDKVEWDPKSGPNDAPDWPLDVEGLSAAAQASFAKAPGLAAGAKAHLALWARLRDYPRFMGAWKAQPTEVVDAFLELATQITGPSGFWRKTVPNKWLGCEANGETEPCQKVAGMKAELAQWDPLIDKLQKLEPEQAQKFIQKNLGKMLAYVDTYVPVTDDPEGAKATPFFAKHLATALAGVL